jgi:histidine ammonia-lyase
VERCSPRTRAAFELVRERVAFLDGDRYLDEDIAATVELISTGAFSELPH